MLLLHVNFIVACLQWKKWFIDEIIYNNNNKLIVLMMIIAIYHSDAGGLLQSVIILYIMFTYNRGSQIPGTRSTRQLILFGGFQYLWVLSIAVASCHPSGIQNFNVAPRFLENLCTCDVKVRWFLSCSGTVYLTKHHA